MNIDTFDTYRCINLYTNTHTHPYIHKRICIDLPTNTHTHQYIHKRYRRSNFSQLC